MMRHPTEPQDFTATTAVADSRTTDSRTSGVQASRRPTRKAFATTAATALYPLAIWILNTYMLPEPIPMDVAAAVLPFIIAALAYWMPPAERDTVAAKPTAAKHTLAKHTLSVAQSTAEGNANG